jgi:hypothetical protein
MEAELTEAHQLSDALGDDTGEVLPWEGDGNGVVVNARGRRCRHDMLLRGRRGASRAPAAKVEGHGCR